MDMSKHWIRDVNGVGVGWVDIAYSCPAIGNHVPMLDYTCLKAGQVKLDKAGWDVLGLVKLSKSFFLHTN